MGSVIETIRSTGSDYWAAYVGGEKSKQTDLNNTPEPMSLPNNDLSYYNDDIYCYYVLAFNK